MRGDIFKGTVSEQNKSFELNIKLNNRKSYKSFAHLKLYTEIFSFSIHSIIDQDTGVGFPGGAVVENLPANAGDTGSSPGLGRSHMPQSN